MEMLLPAAVLTRAANDPTVFTTTVKAPLAFSWLKLPASAFTFKTLYMKTLC